VRHIPEEELHAYLDQALSRSQCVEIERHLARCPRCQLLRDDIAALRDRTTELLARLGPPPIIPPAFETLKVRRAERTRVRWRRVGMGAWAASLLAAVALGWQVHRQAHPGPTPPSTAVVEAVSPLAPNQTSAPAAFDPAPRAVRPVRRLAAAEPAKAPARSEPAAGYASAVETDASVLPVAAASRSLTVGSAPLDLPDLVTQPVSIDPELQGLWRTIAPDSGGPPLAGDIPRVPGLPVVQMRVQPGNGASDVTAVDQVLETGDVIRTIAGPATRVGSLVLDSGRLNPHGADPAGGRMTVTIRQGDRMVAVTGPSQALGSLLSRVNVTRRRY